MCSWGKSGTRRGESCSIANAVIASSRTIEHAVNIYQKLVYPTTVGYSEQIRAVAVGQSSFL